MSPSQVCIGAAMGSVALIDDRQLSATHDESSSAGRFAMNEPFPMEAGLKVD